MEGTHPHQTYCSSRRWQLSVLGMSALGVTDGVRIEDYGHQHQRSMSVDVELLVGDDLHKDPVVKNHLDTS